jgi:hypothetical protein
LNKRAYAEDVYSLVMYKFVDVGSSRGVSMLEKFRSGASKAGKI